MSRRLTYNNHDHRNNDFWKGSLASSKSVSETDIGRPNNMNDNNNNNDEQQELFGCSPLCFSVDELSEIVDGKGRARMVWDSLRRGQNPTTDAEINSNGSSNSGNGLGRKALENLHSAFPSLSNGGDIESNICRVEQITKTPLSTKLLIRYLHDNALVETVIIPMNNDDNGNNNKRPYSTLCVSSQVGCRQACTFCDTGRMGKLRSLTTDEILVQVYLAQKYNNDNDNADADDENSGNSNSPNYDIENIVFMGMGEPADNVPAVTEAVRIMTGRTEFQIAPKHVAISTVGISPESFTQLLQNTNATIAWSVHASHDDLRRQLVPTTRHTMVQLRDGLIQALTNRQQSSRNMRRVLLEVTLIKGINDNIQDAQHLANFVTELQQLAPPKTKIIMNLIPYNPSSTDIVIRGVQYQTSPPDRVSAFQNTLTNLGIRTYTRTTRGDDDAAACGQLATKKLMAMEKQQQQEQQ